MKKIAVFLLICCLYSCSKKETNKEERLFPITIATAVQENIPIVIEAIGNVYALQSVEVRPQVGGIVEEAYVSQGGFVKAGDPLYKIDPRPYVAALNQAKGQLIRDEAVLKIASITVDTYSALVEKDYVAKLNFEQYLADVDKARGQVLVDKASVDNAALNLSWTTIMSPIDGKISQYNIDPGNLVVANDDNALTTILMLDPADIRFSINQKDFVRVQQAIEENTLNFDVFLPQHLSSPRAGEIYFIDNTLNVNTGTILLKGTVSNSDGFFWPGEFIRVQLHLKNEPDAVLVPQEAVKVGQKGNYVFVYNDKSATVELRKVEIGETIDKKTVIKEGVKAQEKVVTKGQLNLTDKVRVKVVEDQG